MLKGFDKDGNLKDVIVNKEGAIMVAMEQSGGDEVETTLNASVQNIGTTSSQIPINKKVTSIDIANYSETANITITIGDLQAVIGSNIATTLVVNANITNIELESTEEDTKVQIIVKGVN